MNASNNTFTNFLHGTQVDNPSSGVHGVTGTIVGTSDTQTLTNKTLTSPRIGTSILDTNGNELLLLTATGSAVNELTLANAAAGFDPTLSSTGTDTDIGIALETKGAGAVSIGSASATDSGILEIFDDTGGESASITVPTAITTGYTLTLPDGVGSSGQFLRTDGNNPATLTWVTPGGGGDVSGPGSSTDNAVVRWNGTSGTAVQDSGHTIGDNGDYVLSGSAAYIELPDITAPSNPGAGLGRLYKKTGNDGIFWLPDGAGPEVDLTAGSAAALSAVLAVGNTTGGNDIVMSGASDTLNFTRTNNLILDAATIATADRTVTFPDPGGADNVVYEALAQTLTNKTLTAPTLNAVPTFSLDDTDSAFNLVIQSTSTITTADKTLTLDVNDANRTIGLGGNITTAGDFTTSGAFALTLTQTGATNVTLPTTGTLATLAGTETFTNKTITSPIINQITTDGTEEVLIFADGGTAVNEFTMTNAATGVDPMLSATGGDANIGIALETKGTGTVTIGSASATDSGILEIFDDTGGESASITVPTAITTAYTLALPDGVGSSGQFLSTDGNNPATLTWASGGGGDTVDTVTTTDATTTTISTIATSSDTTYFLSAKLVARRTDSGSESAGYKLMATYRNNGGTLSQVSSDDLLSQEDSAQWNVDTTISGTNIIIEVTGQSSKTINWKSSWNTTDV